MFEWSSKHYLYFLNTAIIRFSFLNCACIFLVHLFRDLHTFRTQHFTTLHRKSTTNQKKNATPLNRDTQKPSTAKGARFAQLNRVRDHHLPLASPHPSLNYIFKHPHSHQPFTQQQKNARKAPAEIVGGLSPKKKRAHAQRDEKRLSRPPSANKGLVVVFFSHFRRRRRRRRPSTVDTHTPNKKPTPVKQRWRERERESKP